MASLKKRAMERLPLYLLILVISACKPGNRQVQKANVDSDLLARMDSMPSKLKDVNAFYLAYIDASGTVYEHSRGLNSAGKPVSDSTLFEGASLSKTVFACLYWHLLNRGAISSRPVYLPTCGLKTTEPVPPLLLLNHLVPCADSCVETTMPWHVFSYSESGYLLLQEALERQTGKSLEDLAQQEIFKPNGIRASFVWNDANTDFVNGYYEKDRLHRSIYKLGKPQSNGSLYISGENLVRFTKMLMASQELDSMSSVSDPVPNFDQLAWGRGIGIETKQGKKYVWQWGCNWSYNHLLLINRTDHSALILLTNSIIGAKRARESVNWLLGTNFQLFDYINWY